MKLTQLVLENVGPFFESYEVNLAVTPEAPVILVHGENERGKTSFVNAIRWCLYGEALGRAPGQRIPAYALMNNHAKDLGVYNMSVRLEFEHEGGSYVLERHVQCSRPPTDDGDLVPHLSLRKNGNFEPAQTIQRVVNGFLHPEISRFFLFDGEMLNEYEILLQDQNRSTDIVRQSIEQILGLPALQRAAKSLEGMRRVAEKRELADARARAQNETLIARAQQMAEAVAAAERDIEQHHDLRDRLELERESLRQQLEQFAEVQADLHQLDRLEEEASRIDGEAKEKRREIQLLLKQGWWLPVEKLVEREAEQSEAAAEAATATMMRLSDLRRAIQELDHTTHERQCHLCGQSLEPGKVVELDLRRQELTRDAAALQTNWIDPTRLHERIRQLRPFRGQDNGRVLREKESVWRRLRIQRHKIEGEVDAIRERVRTESRSEVADVERQLEQCLTQLSTIEGLLRDAREKRREQSEALQRLQNQIRSLPSANRRLAVEEEVYAGLRNLFKHGIAEFRDRLRVQVEHEASRIHSKLTTDQDYRGLKINDQYGLTLLTESGREIPYRSAGSEQIVALALIGALNRCATREGPIVMDTPFGRLDRGHRKRVLEFAPHLGPQVVLLVQSGEMERDRDIGVLDGKIAREFRIERAGATDRSRIQPIE